MTSSESTSAGRTYDTVIIGAGLSGLAAGIRLAYFDKSVCIVEKHTTIGGLNSFYRLRKRDYDVGLHAITNYAPPGTKTGPLSKLLRQLRLSWDDFALVPQQESVIAFPGHQIRFDNDFESLQQQVAENFPDQADRFARLARQVQDFDEFDLQQQPLSARQVLGDIITDPLLIDMLFCPLMFYGSATPGDMDFRQFVIMFKSIFCQGFARPFEGVRRIMKHIVRQYKATGGELRLRCGVEKVLIENNRAVGVRLENGEEISAHHVLSSAGSAETANLCSGVAFPDAEFQPGGISFVETIAALDCQPADLGHTETIIFYNNADRFHYECPEAPVDLRSGIICSPNNFRYDQPLDEGCVRITALANPKYWMDWPQAEYVREKERWNAEISAAALAHIPDFRPHVVDTDMFTPRTIRRFTGHLNGCVYGAPFKHFDGLTPVENLFLCGTDQGFLGIVGSMLSGISIANMHLLK